MGSEEKHGFQVAKFNFVDAYRYLVNVVLVLFTYCLLKSSQHFYKVRKKCHDSCKPKHQEVITTDLGGVLLMCFTAWIG